jgi:hypothetical protein
MKRFRADDDDFGIVVREIILPQRIALIHAVTVAISPIAEAFKTHWPEARTVNILDDSLSDDRQTSSELTPDMFSRFDTLTRYAIGIGSAAVLFTCCAFGEAIAAAGSKASVPVFKPNEAMFETALDAGGRIGMLATFEPGVASMKQEFDELTRQRGVDASLETICVPRAMAALKNGDGDLHDALLVEAAASLRQCNAVMLAHFSTARAQARLSKSLACPVLASPASAVLKLKLRFAASAAAA